MMLFRFGREKLDDVATTTTTTATTAAAGVERYDLTSYGDSQQPAIAYGAPGLDDDINDGYAGALPGLGDSNVFSVGDDDDDDIVNSGASEIDEAASDSPSDNDDDDYDATNDNNGDGLSRNDNIPPWCNPTDPMGAWLNYQKIQVK